jgi:hypothetical protein
MKAALFSLIMVLTLPTLYADELQRFWRDFPGFQNRLASYGYDRHFAASAQPEFVDSVIDEISRTTSEQRLAEYVCVLFYMDRAAVTSRLAALESSRDTRDAVARVRGRLAKMKNELSSRNTP